MTAHHSSESIKEKLKEALKATDVEVVDTSSGCGSSFDVSIVSEAFIGKTLIQRHRLVNEALREELKSIHALSIKRAIPPPAPEPVS